MRPAALRGWERVFSISVEQALPARLPLRFAAAKILFDFLLPIGAHGRAGARGVHKAPYRLEIQLGTAAVGVVVRRAVCLDAKAVEMASMFAPRNRNSQPYCFFCRSTSARSSA